MEENIICYNINIINNMIHLLNIDYTTYVQVTKKTRYYIKNIWNITRIILDYNRFLDTLNSMLSHRDHWLPLYGKCFYDSSPYNIAPFSFHHCSKPSNLCMDYRTICKIDLSVISCYLKISYKFFFSCLLDFYVMSTRLYVMLWALCLLLPQ